MELKDPWFQGHDGNKVLPSLEQQERDPGPPQPTSQAAETIPSHLRGNEMSRAGQPRSTAAQAGISIQEKNQLTSPVAGACTPAWRLELSPA